MSKHHNKHIYRDAENVFYVNREIGMERNVINLEPLCEIKDFRVIFIFPAAFQFTLAPTSFFSSPSPTRAQV